MGTGKFVRLCAAALAVLALTGAAQAATFSVPEALPSSLVRGATQSNDARLFSEQTGVTVTDGQVTVDFLAADLDLGVETAGVTNFVSGDPLGAGTYDSFLIHFDPFTRDSTTGTFTFVNDIVAIILSNGRGNRARNPANGLLNLSNAVFGVATTTYDSHVGRRTESHDSFTLLASNELSVDFWTNATHIDNLRVITQAAPVPLPAGIVLILTAMGGLALFRKRASA